MGDLVVNHAILLIRRVNALRRTEGLALEAAVVYGALQCVRPILITGASTVFALLPLVLFSKSPDATIWNAIGYAVLGGMSSATISVLLVTPALYVLLERRAAHPRAADRSAQHYDGHAWPTRHYGG